MKKHTLPFKCKHMIVGKGICQAAFQYLKDRNRHIESIHLRSAPPLYCPVHGCKQSREKGKGMRKDNLNRHIRTQHQDIC